MQSVTICIPNFQCGDTIALCIESIRRFTSYPHNIIVYDDATDQTKYDDLIYLREAQARGWIRLIEGRPHCSHGPAISAILDTVTTDLAMIMDCDIQVLREGWLDKMVAHQGAMGAALVSDIETTPNGSLAFASWFFMLDMRQYPEVKDEWDYTPKAADDPGMGMNTTGYRVYKNIVEQGRIVAPFPDGISAFPSGPDAYYRHHTHISVLSCHRHEARHEAQRAARYTVIQSELARLRAGA